MMDHRGETVVVIRVCEMVRYELHQCSFPEESRS
jgi:hypothetical protein